MKSNIHLGRILGVPIGLNWSWFLVFLFVTWSLSVNYFAITAPGLPGRLNWLLSVSTSVLFFASVLAHELGHAVAAFHYKIPVRSITLFIFGGVADIEEEPRQPKAEFWIAIFGPLTSLLLGLLFGLIWYFLKDSFYLAAPLEWLAIVNIALAIFNMIPGFPLDGGRVLRALIWWRTRSYGRATRLASSSGQWVSFGFIGIGVVILFTGNTLHGLWLAFVGWFLLNAAIRSYAAQTGDPLKSIRVSQVMDRDLHLVAADVTLRELYEDHYLPSGQRDFLITINGQPCGMVTIDRIFALPRPEWAHTTAYQIMTPINSLWQVPADMTLELAIDRMERASLAQVPVVQGGVITGYLSRERVQHYIKQRHR